MSQGLDQPPTFKPRLRAFGKDGRDQQPPVGFLTRVRNIVAWMRSTGQDRIVIEIDRLRIELQITELYNNGWHRKSGPGPAYLRPEERRALNEMGAVDEGLEPE